MLISVRSILRIGGDQRRSGSGLHAAGPIIAIGGLLCCPAQTSVIARNVVSPSCSAFRYWAQEPTSHFRESPSLSDKGQVGGIPTSWMPRERETLIRVELQRPAGGKAERPGTLARLKRDPAAVPRRRLRRRRYVSSPTVMPLAPSRSYRRLYAVEEIAQRQSQNVCDLK